MKIVSLLTQRRAAAWLLLASAAGAFGCPQLLDDGFSTLKLSDADGGPICVEEGCGLPRLGGTGGDESSGGSAGSDPDAGEGDEVGNAGAGSVGSAGAGSAGAGGLGSAGSGSAGSGSAGSGSAGAGSSGGSAGSGAAGSGGTGNPACWTLELDANTHDTSSNCLGIYGWNQIECDPDVGNSNVVLSYQNGDACFTGTVDSIGWGASYTLTFANETNWSATSAGVTGLDFKYSGSQQPASLHVIYKDTRSTDFCHSIGPGETAVPFLDGHPSCASSGSTVTVTQLRELILAFPVNAQPYDVDFCVQISAVN